VVKAREKYFLSKIKFNFWKGFSGKIQKNVFHSCPLKSVTLFGFHFGRGFHDSMPGDLSFFVANSSTGSDN